MKSKNGKSFKLKMAFRYALASTISAFVGATVSYIYSKKEFEKRPPKIERVFLEKVVEVPVEVIPEDPLKKIFKFGVPCIQFSSILLHSKRPDDYSS
jgi:hypothetical protein